VFFQPAALVIDCNGSAVMHQTIDDCGCSVCKWSLGSQASEAAWNCFCRLGSDGRLRTAAGSGGSRHYFCGSVDSTVVLCDDGRHARQCAGCCCRNIPADIGSNRDAAHLDFACDSFIQAIKKSRFRGSKVLPTNNVCRQGKQNCC